MPRTTGHATRDDPGDVSSILRVLADTPAAALEEELRRLEEVHLAGTDHLRADYLAVVRVRELAERRRRREQEISILYSTARLTALRGVDEALENIVRSAHDLVDTDLTYLTVLEENGTRLRVRATAGSISPDFRENFHAPADVGIAGRVAGTWAPYWVADYLGSTEIVHHPDVDRPIRAEGIVSMLGIPLIAGDRFLGTLIAATRKERVFAADDVALLTAFGHHAAVALENSRLYDESRRALQELQRAYATIEASVAVHEALTRMVLAGGDVGDVGGLLVDALGGSVLILDRTGRVVAAHGLPADDDEAAVGSDGALAAVPALATSLSRAIQESRESGRCATVSGEGLTHRHVVAISAANTYLGAVVLSRAGGLKPVDVRTLEHAAQIAALLTLAQRAVVDAEERVRGELLTELMTAERPFSAELQLRARARQVDPNGLTVVLVIDGAGDRRGDVTRLLHDVVSPHAGLAGEHLGVPMALLATDDVEKAAERVHRRLRQVLRMPLLVCATAASPGSDPLGSGFTVATRCCAVLHELGVDDGHTTTADLSIYTVLFDPAKAGTLQAFLDRSLGRLINHDVDRGTDLMGTLGAYFANSSNFARTARSLHIHTNTLTKRIDRISSLLGPDWQQPDVALTLQLAVRLHGLARRVGTLPD
jgi:GAF domain-containing protein/sugar diacid utilization regulator